MRSHGLAAIKSRVRSPFITERSPMTSLSCPASALDQHRSVRAAGRLEQYDGRSDTPPAVPLPSGSKVMIRDLTGQVFLVVQYRFGTTSRWPRPVPTAPAAVEQWTERATWAGFAHRCSCPQVRSRLGTTRGSYTRSPGATGPTMPWLLHVCSDVAARVGSSRYQAAPDLDDRRTKWQVTARSGTVRQRLSGRAADS